MFKLWNKIGRVERGRGQNGAEGVMSSQMAWSSEEEKEEGMGRVATNTSHLASCQSPSLAFLYAVS